MLWYYGVILMSLIVGTVLVLVLVLVGLLVLQATVLETSLLIVMQLVSKISSLCDHNRPTS